MALLALLMAGKPAVWACDLCAIYGAMEAQGGSGQGFFGGVAEQFTRFGTFQSGGHNATNPDGEYLNSLVSQAFAGYNFNERLGLQFNLTVNPGVANPGPALGGPPAPFHFQSMLMKPIPGTPSRHLLAEAATASKGVVRASSSSAPKALIASTSSLRP